MTSSLREPVSAIALGTSSKIYGKQTRRKGPADTYDEALTVEICKEISEGKPLRQICRERGLHWMTLYDWRRRHPKFAERFEAARQMGEDAIAEDCLEIADAKRTDVNRSRLQIDTRLKLLAKWRPAKWGDKIEQTHKGPISLVLSGSDIEG